MIVARASRELVPDHLSWVAVEGSPEHEHDIKNEASGNARPGTVPHEFVVAPGWCEETEVLEEDGHLDEKAEGAVCYFGDIEPLRKMVSLEWSRRVRMYLHRAD